MKTTHKFQTRSVHKMALWGLIAALVLLLSVRGVGAGEQGRAGAREWESTGVWGQGFERVNVSLASSSYTDMPHADMPPANSPPANSPTSNACTVSYTYDRSGRLTSANYGQGKLLVYSYDPAGNLLRRTDHFDTYLPLVMRR